MTRIVTITALLDAEHEAELRVRPGRGEVEIECEDWSGDERHTTRIMVDPSEALEWAAALRRASLEARRGGTGRVEEVEEDVA